jgi:demethylmenaquinone methyltransferase/2-methoxy-6-polyprenyl-1,4-benzoquinol methylase
MVNSASNIKPYSTADKSKKEEVAEMFNNISPSYDFLNRFLSMGIDVGWRKKTVKAVATTNPQHILDVATGTADLAIALSKTGAKEIIGCDISEGMMSIGKQKVAEKNLSNLIRFQLADSENLPFTDERFDAVTVAFGVRNFEHPQVGLKEINRVLKPGGRIHVLEFSQPQRFPVKQLYNFYFKYILPFWGKLISKDNAAYTYLPNSVKAFPHGQAFLDLLESSGFRNNSAKKLTFGIASLYIGEK